MLRKEKSSEWKLSPSPPFCALIVAPNDIISTYLRYVGDEVLVSSRTWRPSFLRAACWPSSVCRGKFGQEPQVVTNLFLPV